MGPAPPFEPSSSGGACPLRPGLEISPGQPLVAEANCCAPPVTVGPSASSPLPRSALLSGGLGLGQCAACPGRYPGQVSCSCSAVLSGYAYSSCAPRVHRANARPVLAGSRDILYAYVLLFCQDMSAQGTEAHLSQFPAGFSAPMLHSWDLGVDTSNVGRWDKEKAHRLCIVGCSSCTGEGKVGCGNVNTRLLIKCQVADQQQEQQQQELILVSLSAKHYVFLCVASCFVHPLVLCYSCSVLRLLLPSPSRLRWFMDKLGVVISRTTEQVYPFFPGCMNIPHSAIAVGLAMFVVRHLRFVCTELGTIKTLMLVQASQERGKDSCCGLFGCQRLIVSIIV